MSDDPKWLFDAAGYGKTAEAFQAKLERSSAQVKYRDEDGWTVLMMMVISHDWPEAAAAVIKRGCNVNAKARDLDNARALHMAVSYDFAETARVLLENGAEKDV